MRDRIILPVALTFLLVSFYAVGVRRSVYSLGGELGELEAQLRETRCLNDNLELVRERLRSPAELVERAEESGIRLHSRDGEEDR